MTRDPGWPCDGTRLVMVMTKDGPLAVANGTVPAVVREDLVWLCDRCTRDMIRQYGTRPFEGGDHVHLGVRND